MNRRKKTSSLGFPSLVLLGIAVVIVSSSGIGYVVMKNKQLTARAEIAKVQERIDSQKVTMILHQLEIERMLDVCELPNFLKERDSRLRLIEMDLVEVYQDPKEEDTTETSNERSVAQR